ncbi:KINASE CX32 putative-RELATED [Salix viminalis]|uniref:KINASE CX32 putative-RELATED n=1 Tax=Salix viminalis TaxID=40686 RepID=A0A9Q0SD84_SALVM|nr:KINASE CX32 putative-RELATED [Salix viminalis]
MDSRLEGKYATGQASEIAMLALRCLVSTPKFRPSMKEVAETLEKIKTRAYNRKHLVMCGKCHEAGHYTRSCEKISQVGGNSKLPNASEVTETLQITPSSSNLLDVSNATKNEKTSAIQSLHPQQGTKRDEANHIATNKPRNNHPRKTTAVGGNSKALEARNTTKKDKTSSSRLNVQQGNTRKDANGVATSPSCNSTPKTKIPTGATTEEKISTTKSIVRQGKKINETNGAVTSTARSKGMSELPNASNVGRKVRAQSTAQQVNKRNVPTHGEFFFMGICWSAESNPSPAAAPASAQAPAPAQALDPFIYPDATPTPPEHLIEGDISFLVSNVSGNSWFSIATTNFTTWISHAKDAIRGKNVPEDVELPALPSKLEVFTLEQLKEATLNFRNDMILGKGGFGIVYKGLLKEKVPFKRSRKLRIAVKKLGSDSKQGLRQWQTEVGFLAKLSHPNIVKLLGCCQEEENRELLIVYEFMERGSLNYHLFGKRSGQQLPWKTRLMIATEMAEALSYLHSMDRPIIFRDFKTSNILLDESYSPRLSDFGLAKWGPNDGTPCVTGNCMGTHGYVAPECKTGGKLYVKSDVYSFGVVLIELLTGLRSVDKKRPPKQQDLREWALPFLTDRKKLRQIMDPGLQGKYSSRQALKIAMLAVRCLYSHPMIRPSMKEVAETLEQLKLRS